jgi:hypothetical protein
MRFRREWRVDRQEGTAVATSFKTDIAPMFSPYQPHMTWRFDITDYETVKSSAGIIYARITGNPNFDQMPPAPMTPLTQEQTDLFNQWMQDGYPP